MAYQAPRWATPPLIDMSPLQRIGQQLQQQGLDARRQEAFAGGGGLSDIGQRLAASGFGDEGLGFMRLAQQEQQLAQQRESQAFDRKYKSGMLDIARQKAVQSLTGKAAAENYYGNAIPIQGPDGVISYGQMGNRGSFRKVDLPEGHTFAPPTRTINTGTHLIIHDQAGNEISRTPINNHQKAFDAGAGGAAGKIQGEAAANLPTELATIDQTITDLDTLINHSGLSAIAGPLNQYRPSWTMGSEGRDALSRFNQVRGRIFLQGFGMLKGGGQITEVEGLKAEQAMARADRALDVAELKYALKDFQDAVRTGAEKLRQRAGQTGSEAAPSAQGRQRLRFNPETGDLE